MIYVLFWVEVMLCLCELQNLMINRYQVFLFTAILSVIVLLTIAPYMSVAQSGYTVATAAAVLKSSNVHNTFTAASPAFT
jgi:uncharacterized membrane protein YcgQ (UPF0703/DUF1980 family)